MSCTKDLCRPQREHRTLRRDPPQAVRELCASDASQTPSHIQHPVVQSQNSHSHGTGGSPSHRVQRIPSQPGELPGPWGEQGCSQNQPPVVPHLGSLSPGACDGLRGWSHFTILSGCPASCQPSLPDSKLVGHADFHLWEDTLVAWC